MPDSELRINVYEQRESMNDWILKTSCLNIKHEDIGLKKFKKIEQERILSKCQNRLFEANALLFKGP